MSTFKVKHGPVQGRLSGKVSETNVRKPLMIDTQGRAIIQVCVSMPSEESAAAERLARELGISKSALVRVAIRQFAASVKR